MTKLFRPALVASLVIAVLAGLVACVGERTTTQDSDRKKNDRRIYAEIVIPTEIAGGTVAA